MIIKKFASFLLKKRIIFAIIFVFIFVRLSLNVIYSQVPEEKSNINSTYYNLVRESAPLCKTPKRISYDALLEQGNRYIKFHHEYKPLAPKPNSTEPGVVQPVKHKYFFAMNLYNNQEIIPHLLQELLRVFEYLGPQNIYFSLYENGSGDSSKYILSMFKVTLDKLGIRNIVSVDREQKPKSVHRIEYLAKLRNKAIEPLETESLNGRKYDKIVFMNDVVFCRNDILELLYQSEHQQSDMTCPLDFDTGGPDGREILFRDTWVARDLGGESFHKGLNDMVPHKPSMERFKNNLPFQVQCCWNGAAVLNAKPFYEPINLKFRRSKAKYNECAASECSLMCNDFWENGFRKIVTVPRVLLPYEMKHFKLLDDYYKLDPIPLPKEEKITYVDGPETVWCVGLEGKDRYSPDQPGKRVKYTTNGTHVTNP
ncbi:hypothetical protein BB559_004157 [Furculomyces boomerangus]|uniref:Alpha-1,3-mannosyltransferase CMT1 n=2 Tax=Furculomyces boomerangus TaxID=61424 RepID=A0A2T9YGH9_9FUNG|nr:hypothetical protein BB559_004157 [Furculomyces boomerangus]